MWRSWKRSRWGYAVLLLCAVMTCGCAYLRPPQIDPTGERIFATPPIAATPWYRDVPGGQLPWDDLSVRLSPHRTVAPVGSEVVLLAGVCGPAGYLSTNRRLEWSIAPGGAGHFVAVGKNGLIDYLLGDFNRPRKIDNTFAVGSTSRNYLRLSRGTPTTTDDVCVRRGEGWITVTSPVEGTSHVAVYAPEVYPWDARTRSATIHWVDAQWRFPPPAINPAGTTHTFTTSVMRHSDQEPCVGWLVRYEIVGGPPAGFAPDGTASIEVTTDSAGQASAEIFQKQPSHGTNQIAVKVIRPAAMGGAGGKRLTVGEGTTSKTWTAAGLAVRKTAPATAGDGTTITYRIEVTNPGDLPAEDVLVTDVLPDAITYIDATPPPESTGKRLQWRVGQLAAGQTHTIELNCRATGKGSVANCADVTAAGGLKARDCATTTVMGATVDVKVTGPSQATVGSNVTFVIVVANRSQAPSGKLLIKDRFGEGLEHAAAASPIERDLGTLAPGQSQRIKVTFRVTRPGRLCHTVEVSGADGVVASAQGCVTVAAAPGVTPTPSTGFGVPAQPTEQPAVQPPAGRPSVSVKKTGPSELGAGQTARFAVEITNDGQVELTNLKVTDRYDPALYPKMATDGHKFENNHLVWTIDRLAVGRTTKLEIHCRCLQPAERTCNRITVECKGGATAEDEACLAIRTAEGKLNIEAADLCDPVRLGKGLTYEVRVSNDGAATDGQVVVVVTVPPGMMPVPIGTNGPKQIRYEIDGRTVRFEPVAEIAPGEKLSYRIRVSTLRAGKVSFRAELTSRNHPQAVTAEETTEVFQ